MKKAIVCLVLVMAVVCFSKEVLAGSTQTEGQGTRPISMGGAFIAVADSPEAVFYNPAGLTQVKKAEVTVGSLIINPTNKYDHKATGNEYQSKKEAVGAYTFTNTPLTESFSLGFGVYAPFSRDADYDADYLTDFGNLYATTIRLDISPVIAYKADEKLSVGLGLIAAQGKTEQSVQTAYGNGVYADDDIDGWGYSGLVGILYKLNEQIKIGGVYRGRMIIRQTGHREQTGWTTPRDITTKLRYPATAGVGITYMPDNKLTMAFDLDWNDWSYFDKAVTQVHNAADSVTQVVCHDTLDYRAGLEYKLDETLTLRSGFMYIPGATPSEFILPQKPDYKSSYALTFGVGKALKNITLGFLYEYTRCNPWNVDDNAYGYNGRYEANVHTIGMDVKYTF